MLLLHKHGDDCMLVSKFPFWSTSWLILTISLTWLNSTRGERSQVGRNGFFELTCVSQGAHR